MAYMLSANMDQGAKDFQLEAAISKVYASVSLTFTPKALVKCHVVTEKLLNMTTVNYC